MRLRSLALAGLVALAAYLPTASAEAASKFLGGIEIGKNAASWEVRGGAAAYDTGPFSSQTFTGTVINGEILAPSPDFLSWAGSPRPYIGTDIAISHDAIDVFYAGLNWEAYLTSRFYLGFSGGGSVNTKTKVTADDGRTKDLGSSVLFHLQASAGFDITPRLTAQVYLNHFSDANLATSNDGLESTGVRLGLRF